jgi:soluble calcium-activated nucleotidase 1
MAAFGLLLAFALLYLALVSKRTDDNDTPSRLPVDQNQLNQMFGNKLLYAPYNDGVSRAYDSTYPLSRPEINVKDKTHTYKILAIADLDTNSKVSGSESKYISYLLHGRLTVADDLNSASVEFDSQPTELNSEYAYGGRGMELSELVVFNGKLYSCDDRTGIVYEILPDKKMALPWVVLIDGNGRNTSKGM